MNDPIFTLANAYRDLAFEYRDLITDIANHVSHSAELGLTTVDSHILLERVDVGQRRMKEINDKVIDKCQASNK